MPDEDDGLSSAPLIGAENDGGEIHDANASRMRNLIYADIYVCSIFDDNVIHVLRACPSSRRSRFP